MHSHTPSSVDSSPFLEDRGSNSRSPGPQPYAAHRQHFNVGLMFLLMSVCGDTEQVTAELSGNMRSLMFLLMSVCGDTEQVTAELSGNMRSVSSSWLDKKEG